VPSRSMCPACGAALSAEARYCDRCGTPLSEKTASTPSRRRETSPAGRVALWVFIGILLFVFAGGAIGGYRLKSGHWPFQTLAAAPPASSSSLNASPANPTPKENSPTVTRYLRSVVSIDARDRSGSGFIIDNKGHVITAAHVVEGSRGCVTVTDDNGRPHQGTVLPYSSVTDAAMIYVPELAGWPDHLEFTSSQSLTPGDSVYVLGSPKGIGSPVRQAATVAKLGVGQTVEGRYFRNLIQLNDAVVHEGTSGGPVVLKSTGRVVGMVNASGGSTTASWAVPADDLVPLITGWLSQTPGNSCLFEKAVRTVPVVLTSITPRTGMYGVEGDDLADGADLALREMDALLRRVGYEVTLRREDDGGVPSAARDKAAAAAYDPNVIGVVGSLDNAATKSVAEVLEASGLTVVAPTAGAGDLTSFGWRHFSRLVANSNKQELALADFAAQTLKVKGTYLLDDGTPAASLLISDFRKAATGAGLTMAGQGTVGLSTDWAALKQKLLTAKPDAIYYAGSSDVGLRLVQGLRQEGVLLPVLGSQALANSARFQSYAGQGVFFTGLTAEPNEQFRRKFETVMGKPTRGYATYGYDAARVILEALVRYGEANPSKVPTRQELAALVRETKDYAGWAVRVSFGSDGENKAARIYIYEWRQGVPELWER